MWHDDSPGGIHEPIELLLPEMPARPTHYPLGDHCRWQIVAGLGRYQWLVAASGLPKRPCRPAGGGRKSIDQVRSERRLLTCRYRSATMKRLDGSSAIRCAHPKGPRIVGGFAPLPPRRSKTTKSMTGKTPKHLRHRRCGVKGRYMARALLGYVGSASEQTLTLEVVRLRRRVEELETEVAELRINPSPGTRSCARYGAAPSSRGCRTGSGLRPCERSESAAPGLPEAGPRIRRARFFRGRCRQADPGDSCTSNR